MLKGGEYIHRYMNLEMIINGPTLVWYTAALSKAKCSSITWIDEKLIHQFTKKDRK